MTPLANLKVLIAAASSAMENESCRGESVTVEAKSEGQEKACKEPEDGGGRKMRSLAILCKK